MKQPYVYIMDSRRNGTLYTGVTADLPRRVWEHRNGVVEGFTHRYQVRLLVWYEQHGSDVGFGSPAPSPTSRARPRLPYAG